MKLIKNNSNQFEIAKIYGLSILFFILCFSLYINIVLPFRDIPINKAIVTLTFGEMILYFTIFIFIMTVIIPFIRVNILNLKRMFFENTINENSSWGIKEKLLKEYSIINNNSVTYSIYLNHIKKKQIINNFGDICLSLPVFIISNFPLRYSELFNDSNLFLEKLLYSVIILVCLYLIYLAFISTDPYKNKDIGLNSKMVEEVNSFFKSDG